MTKVTLIYCAGGNRKFARIAAEEGLAYGLRSDHKLCPGLPVAMLDINYKQPDIGLHLRVAEKLHPALTVIPDIYSLADLPETLALAVYVKDLTGGQVCIVPKCSGIIERIPNLPYIVLGYSVSSAYGGGADDSSPLPFEWASWPGGVHLLGGNPQAQIRTAHQLPAQVVSLDNNMIAKMSSMAIWRNGFQPLRHHPEVFEKPIYLAAFRLSCRNLVAAWAEHEKHSAPPN